MVVSSMGGKGELGVSMRVAEKRRIRLEFLKHFLFRHNLEYIALI